METSEQTMTEQAAAELDKVYEQPTVKPSEGDLEREHKLHTLEVQLRQQARGVSKFYDEGMSDLDGLHKRFASELGAIEAKRYTADRRAQLAAEVRKRALAEVEAIGKVARSRLELARARVADELLPPVGRSADRDRAERELADELALRPDTPTALTAMFRESLRAGDTYAARVIAGDWGRRRYMGTGGTAEGWAALRRDMIRTAAEGTQGADRRRYDFLLTAGPEQLLTIAQVAATRSAEAIR